MFKKILIANDGSEGAFRRLIPHCGWRIPTRRSST
jgi:hypothetical protein